MERDAKEKVLTPPLAVATGGFKSKLIKFFNLHACCSASLFKYNCSKIGKRALKLDPTLDKLIAAIEKLNVVKQNIGLLNSEVDKSPLHYGGNSSSTTNIREEGHDLVVDEFTGRDREKKTVLEFLSDIGGHEQKYHKICALTISGVGGVGKTTLAQSVYNDDSLDFQVKMWVCVSNNNDEMSLLMQKAIASATRNPLKADTMTNLQEELKEIVRSKKCLLVLDDVWDDQVKQNQQQWENFVGVLSKHAERGSKILITSRIESIAEVILQGLPVKKESFLLGCLAEDESLSLFDKHAFFGVHLNKLTALKVVGKEIAKKYGGLPLVLKIIGGLLNTRLEYSYWVSVLGKNILNLDKSMDNVKKVLKLSYQCLPSNVKSCFRICSLFPQDYTFKKDELVTLWMGLGCINQSKDENTQPEDIGRNYLEMLVRRSFFIQHKWRYTMHDLVHDLARDISTGECLRVEGNKSSTLPNTLSHLFVDQLHPDLVKQISSLKRLRTLALNYNNKSYLYPEDFPDFGEVYGFLKHSTNLRALFISSRTMPSLSVIEQLKHLRLFHIEVPILNKPLKPLHKLYQLQNLKCEEGVVGNAHEPIEVDVDGIGNFVKLRHLVLPKRIFGQISQLRHLTELQEVELHLKEETVLKLGDVKDLNKLRHLSIIDERGITNFQEAKEANIDKKMHLEKFSLSLNRIDTDYQRHEQLYNCLQPQTGSKIKDLKVSHYNGLRAPTWMTTDYLPFLTHLELSNCENLKHLPPLGQLPSLTILILCNIPGIKQLGTQFFGSKGITGFMSLEVLRITNMENWEEWTGTEKTSWFPCLKELYIENCQQLKQFPALPHSLKKFKLKSVGLTDLPTLQDIDDHEGSTSSINIPVLEEMKIKNCQELMNTQQLLSKCICLVELYIEDCKSLKELPALPFSLKDLHIELVGLTALESWHEANDSEIKLPLERLCIRNCKELSCVQPFLRKCTSLKSLWIAECPQILQSHESNNLNQVTSSICLDLFDGLSSLRDLLLGDVANIRTLDFLEGLSLETLSIGRFEKLISLDGLQALTSLTHLTIRECNNLITSSSSVASTEPFDGTHPPFFFGIESLDIDNILLLQIEPLRSMKSVELLSVCGDVHASWLPHQWLLQNHTSLRTLVIINCSVLESLPDELLPSLTNLEIMGCLRMELLPEKILPSLEYMWISDCPLLKGRYKRDGGSHWPKIAHIPRLHIV